MTISLGFLHNTDSHGRRKKSIPIIIPIFLILSLLGFSFDPFIGIILSLVSVVIVILLYKKKTVYSNAAEAYEIEMKNRMQS
ncbi:MAG: hypothetical protein INQ03_14715 [Candidatus Heimdallarchaeota archaeon]|nr:hypothetical protein [Candidatus Heimdallarchaeota archaeon]